jgi:hypothetical protein
VHTYPVTKEKEINIFKDTLYNNKYNRNLGTRHPTNTNITKTQIHNTFKSKGPLSHTTVKKHRKLQKFLKKKQK